MMTIEDFDQALQEQGSKIQQAYGELKSNQVREVMEATSPDDGWDPWST
jgi:hypothetical protein